MTKRTRTDEINAVGDLLFRRGDAPQTARPTSAGARSAVGAQETAAPGGPSEIAPGRSLDKHPASAVGTERRARRDVFDLDPRRILERGPYIREWDEDGEEFERLVAAVGTRGEVDTPIWVRSEGPAGQRTFILVAGKGRLKAALRADLRLVPVRDLGELSDSEAIGRQAEENLHRRNMSPAETAFALWLMHTHGAGVTDIARRVQRDKGYVSVMVKVGEALNELSTSDRTALGRPGALQVRQCQAIAALPSLPERIEELRRLLVAAKERGVVPHNDDPEAAYRNPDPGVPGEPDVELPAASPVERAASRRAAVDATPFYGKAIRHGRTFRMRWVRDDLVRDPAALADGFAAAMRAEGEELLQALDALESEAGQGSQPVDRSAIVRARQTIASLLRTKR